MNKKITFESFIYYGTPFLININKLSVEIVEPKTYKIVGYISRTDFAIGKRFALLDEWIIPGSTKLCNYIDEHQPLPPDYDRPEDNLDGCRAICILVGFAIATLVIIFLVLKYS